MINYILPLCCQNQRLIKVIPVYSKTLLLTATVNNFMLTQGQFHFTNNKTVLLTLTDITNYELNKTKLIFLGASH